MAAPLEGSSPGGGLGPPGDAHPESALIQPPRIIEDTADRDLPSSTNPYGSDREFKEDGQYLVPGSREKPRANGGRKPSGSKVCGKCGGSLTGQFVRALGDTFHLDCFTCNDCGKIVASKFFPVPDQGPNQYPLCETDYFRRLDLLCFACGGALRGSYITALERKYHIEHFTCSVCPTVFGAQDSYYEHEGNVYCHFHYSTKFAQRCNGCQTSILKQFVELFRNGQNQHWHPECYMIHKYWNVRLQTPDQRILEQIDSPEDASDEVRQAVRTEEERIEEKVLWIWRTLSAFEEKSATCISDMLLHVSNGAYIDGVMAAKKFIVHIDLLFTAADDLDNLLSSNTPKGLTYSREAKLLCKKVVAFFQLLSESQDTGVRRLGVTQELLSLVTGLAHYLKLLIRICLQGSLRLERESGARDGLTRFLNHVNSLEDRMEAESNPDPVAESALYTPRWADICPVCDKSVEDKCYRKANRIFHLPCMACQKCGTELHEKPADARWSNSLQRILCANCAGPVIDAEGGFMPVSKLKQYVHLLRVAHARLLATLRTSGALPHTSDDPNLTEYDSSRGHRVGPGGGELEAPLLRSDTRSKSYTGSGAEGQGGSSYEQTLDGIRRLRSTRLDKHLSTSMRRARSSRIIDGPEGIRPGDGNEPHERGQGMQIVQERDMDVETDQRLDLNSLALDDIPRIVAAEQARDQRPNASKYARGPLTGQEPRAKLLNGHRRDMSADQDFGAPIDLNNQYRPRKYFSELSVLEYFIVRHLAVLLMQPLLDGQFNQEELLDLIETKRPTFWGKVGKAFKNDKAKATGKKKGVFGRSLEQVVEKEGAESTDGVGAGTLRIPALVQDAISAMRNMDMSVEGVFRKNGNIKRLNDLVATIDAEGGDAVDLTQETPVQVAALLKKFLRDMPDPLLTHKLYRLFITAARLPDAEKRLRVFHLTCCLLPKAHRDTMEVLFSFLQWVSSFHTVDEESGSKMDIHNLATVIAPNILWFGDGKRPDMDQSLLAIEVISILIECNESMCEVPEDISSMLGDSSLWANNPDLTTKEILKRFGEIGKTPQITAGPNGAQPQRSKDSRGQAPAVTRVNTDNQAWQNESSVRHVAAPGGQGTGYGSSHNTPPQADYDLGTPNPPYMHQTGSTESHGSNNSPNRHSYRSPPMQKQGALGITGAG